MELKKGYQLTDSGMIPEDWRIKRLTDLGILKGGATPSMANPEYWKNGTIPWASSGEIKFSHISETTLKITSSALKRTSTKLVPTNSILFVMRSGILRNYFPVAKADIPIAINQDLKALIPNPCESADFILQTMIKNGPKILGSCLKTGTTVESIEFSWLKSFPLYFPPTLAEQQSIAEALCDTDSLIESLEQLIGKKRQIKQGAMQELLQPKEGWELFEMGEIADPNQQWSFTGGPFGSNLKSSDYKDDGVRIIQLQNIGDGVFKDDYKIFTSVAKADELMSCNIFPGELILSKMGDPVARACIIPQNDSRYLMCSDGIRLAVDKKRFDPFYIYTMINSSSFRIKADSASTGSTRKRIGLSELRHLTLMCPAIRIQNLIAETFSDMENEIEALEEKLAKIYLIKQGMMQELLTGKDSPGMKTIQLNGNTYRLPSQQSGFQRALYVHLIDWKWAHITREPGYDRGEWYDAILPEAYRERMPMLYPSVKDALQVHQARFPFLPHNYFNHMASSQAANANLFLPILLHPEAAAILSALRPDLARIASGQLDRGFRIEYWDEPFGTLGDHKSAIGTDADIAIAYYNQQDELCLWLVEHKLRESEFTACGGSKSRGRQTRHDCAHSFAELLADPTPCYYHDACHYRYWEITRRNRDFFANPSGFQACPFRGGLNQLWRNQLLALSVKQDERQPYQHVTFSVVHHPRNTALAPALQSYRRLIAGNPKFSSFTSADLLASAARLRDPALDAWITWYRELYDI